MAYGIGSSFRRAVREMSDHCLERFPQLESVRVYRHGDTSTFTGYQRKSGHVNADAAVDEYVGPRRV